MSHHPHPEADCETLADSLSLSSQPPGSSPPPPPVRGARLFAAGDGLLTRVDTLLERWLPRPLNPLAQLGPAANAMLLLATVSGVLLLIWYSASVQSAWHSLADLGPRSLGGIVRSVHRYSSDLTMLLVLAHAGRALLARKFAGARWLAWVSGLGLLALVWFIGWTGYWLVWDQRAQLLAVDTMKVLDVLPVFGEPLQRLFTADRTVPSLLFFVVFFLHMALPLGIAAGLVLHLARLSRAHWLPDWRLVAWLVGAILVAALIYPAANAAPAQMAVKPAALTLDWWYLWPLAITARLSGGGIWLATLLAAAGLVTVPWWLARRRARATFQATVNPSRCFSCTLCSHDCPFGAITMVPRTDGKPFPSQAQVDPDRCVGCGICAGACDTQAIGLSWFDAQQVARDLETVVTGGVSRGTPPALALVCAQTGGGWELFDHFAWARRLPGYAVRPIPCSGWVEPKLLERLIGKGATAVLIVGCGSAEAFGREGNRWMPARLAGMREPAFRPNRADTRKTAHVNYDPLRPQLLTAAAMRLRDLQPMAAAPARSRFKALAAGLVLTTFALAALLWVSDAPLRNPAPADAEFVFTFRALGGRLSDHASSSSLAAGQENRPVHMRALAPAGRARTAVVVSVEVDGQVERRFFRPKGLKSDGASVGEWRVSLAPGRHRIAVSVASGETPAASRQDWTGEVQAVEGRLVVLSFDSVVGFQLEP
jgi:ferredoxin